MPILNRKGESGLLFFNRISNEDMKKTILLIAAVMVAATVAAPAYAGKKKDKKKTAAPVVVEEVAPVEPVVEITDHNDTLNYAAGMNASRGMLDYVKKKYNLDDAHIPMFLEALKEGVAKYEDADFKARSAGHQIADVLKQNIMNVVNKDMKGTTATYKEDVFMRGFFDAVKGDSSVFKVNDASKLFEDEMAELKKVRDEKYKQENAEWLAENKTKEGVVTTESGLQYRIVKTGNGLLPNKDGKVTVKYEGKLIDGTVFDSSYTRNPDTTTFSPGQVIKGWTEALLMMPEGSVWELYIPQELGYGARAAGKIPPYSTLIFTVEVVKVIPPAEVSNTTSSKPANTLKKPATAIKKPSTKR